jgi:class 3 adenylate cyclase
MADRDTEPLLPDGGESQPRAMVMFCDLVGSTELSGRHEPERYGLLVRRYITEVRTTIEARFGGYVASEAGDGLMALFGAMHAHGDDAERAIRAALEVVERIRALSVETEQDIGEALAVRIGIHRGPVYRTVGDAIYGLTVNVAARLQTLASPNTILVSDEVQRMVGYLFDTEAEEPHLVKGVEELIQAHRVVGERVDRPVRRERRTRPVDRVTEWERLHTAWQAVRAGTGGHPPALLLRGEAGVGKSYLASKVAGVAADDGAPVVEIAGSAIEDSGLYPVRRLIESSVGIRRGAGGTERLQRLRDHLTHRGLGQDTLVSRLAPILGLEPEAGYVAEPLDARKLNEEVLDAAYIYVNSFLVNAPSVLVFEDVQWYDRSTRELMARLARWNEASLVVMTARPGGVSVEGVEVIDLEPFSEQDSGLLVDALCDQQPMSAEIRLEVIARSDGIPLYIEELVANIQQGLASLPDERTARSSGAVPDLLYDLLAARLATGADLLPVVTAAAVTGRDIDRHLLQALLDIPLTEVDVALDTLCEKGVLERPLAAERQYRFRHELLREVAYELQPPSRRRHAHGRVADALLVRAANGRIVDWSVIAAHFEQAERWLEASEAYERAAGAARGRGAFTEARRCLSRAIDFLASTVEGLDRIVREVKLRLQRGYLAVSEEGHASPAAAADYDRCLELAAVDPLGDEMFETVIVLWTYHLIRGEIAQARRISEFTYRSLEKREWYRSFNLAAFGILEGFEGEFQSARDRLETFAATRVPANEQRFVAEWFNPQEPVTGILSSVGLVRFVTGDVVGAERAFGDAVERGESMQFPQGPYSVVYALSLEAWMRLELEQFDEAEERISRLSEISARHGFDGWSMVGTTQQAVLAALRALRGTTDDTDLAEHASSLKVITDLWEQFNTRIFLPYYLIVAGILYGGAGDKRQAKSCLEDSLSLAGVTGMNFWRAETLRHFALLDLYPMGRRAGLREALEVARAQRASFFELRIALDLANLDRREGGADIERALEQLGRNPMYQEVARAEAVLATLE